MQQTIVQANEEQTVEIHREFSVRATVLKPKPRGFLPAVQGLRGFSALIVFFFHVYDMSRKQGFFPQTSPLVPRIFTLGQQGVAVFFMISGFLIVGSLISHANVRRFLLDRCIRIYPVFLTIHLISFLVGPLVGYKVFAHVAPSGIFVMFWENLLFLPGIFNLPIVQMNAWSLSFEALFYLIAAATYVVAFRAGRMSAWLFLTMITLPLLWLYPQGIFFVVGSLIYFLRPGLSYSPPRYLSTISLIVMLLVVALAKAGETENRLVMYAAAIPGMIAFWSIIDGKCWLSSVFSSRTFQYLGTISYSFYLWHPVVTFPLKMIFAKLAPRIGAVPAVAGFGLVGLVGSLAVAHLSQKLLEDKLAKYLKRRFSPVSKPSGLAILSGVTEA